MKRNWLLTTVTTLALSIGGSANAAMIAGWDFSQYFGDGLLSVDGETMTDVLPANYSDLDPTFGAGAESAAYGRMYLNGQFGSTATPLDIDNDAFVPSAAAAGSLGSNGAAPAGVPFDTLNVLTAEGQTFANLQVMAALHATSVVFEASPGLQSTDWSFAFGGKTFSGAASVGVEFSIDGSGYTSVGTASLTTVDTPFSFALPNLLGQNGYVRLTFQEPVGTAVPFIDNVSFSAVPVPESGTALLLFAGLAGLAKAGNRKT